MGEKNVVSNFDQWLSSVQPILVEDEKSKELLGRLFEYYCERPELMPNGYFRNVEDEGVKRCVCDYISSMTDRFAIDTYSALFVPRVWGGKV